MAGAGGGRKKKAEEDPSLPAACGRCCLRFLVLLKRVYHALLRPSIHSFFFWSFVIYTVCGGTIAVVSGVANSFFCAVRPQSDCGGMGCANCTSSLLLCNKASCWRNAMNISIMANATTSQQTLFESFEDASTDTGCNALAADPEVHDPVGMVAAIYNKKSTVGENCMTFHCGVLKNALMIFSDLNSKTGVCTDVYDSKRAVEAQTCVCDDLLTTSRFHTGEIAHGLTTFTPTSLAGLAIQDVCGNTFLRKMSEMCLWESVQPSWCAVEATARRLALEAGPVSLADSEGSAGDARGEAEDTRREPAPTPPPPTPSPPARQRRLQEGEEATVTSSGGVKNDDLQDYEVGAWSRCTCYQQCVRGVRTRLVECLSSACREPKPPTRESCTCAHCAQCVIDLRLLVLYAVYFVQAFFALIVFACYLHSTGQTEDDFIKIGFLRKCGGFFYKQLPPFLRVLVMVQLFQVIWLVFDVWVAHLAKEYLQDHQKDCFASKDLRDACIITGVLWLIQVLLGRCAKSHARKPDWLYAPERPSRRFPIKQIRKCLRCLGP